MMSMCIQWVSVILRLLSVAKSFTKLVDFAEQNCHLILDQRNRHFVTMSGVQYPMPPGLISITLLPLLDRNVV